MTKTTKLDYKAELQKELNDVVRTRSENALKKVSDRLYEEFVNGRISLSEIETMAKTARAAARQS